MQTIVSKENEPIALLTCESVDTQGHELFDEYRHDGIPIFVINLGEDVPLATRVLEYMLERVYEYPPGTAFQCEVYDEGPASEEDEEPNEG